MAECPLPVDAGEFYQVLVENAAEGMLTIDEESNIVYANPAVEDILGYGPEELEGSSKMKIIPERLRPVHAEALRTYVESGERNVDWDGIELPALHKDGHEVPTLISLREHRHDGKRYFTGIIRDISERRKREEELSEQLSQLEEFAEFLAHDIRNPLSVAQGYTELAREQHDAPEMEQVAAALDRIDDLVDDVLALSRNGRYIGATETVDVERSAHVAWRHVDTGAGTFGIDDDLGTIEADESRFREFLGNLFGNAIDHAGDAVTVTMGALSEDDGFYVADDGPGIPSDERDRVFERGYTTHDDGTGYGLSIVRQIVHAHGWTIDVTESETGGASFEIRTDPDTTPE